MNLSKIVNDVAEAEGLEDLPEGFDYKGFEEATGKSRNDEVTVKDALLAYDLAAVKLDNCRIVNDRNNSKEESSKMGFGEVLTYGGIAYLLYKFFVPKTQ